MPETDRIYGWITNVINSCKNSTHLEYCEVLIKFYQKRGASEDDIKALRHAVDVKREIVRQETKETDALTKEGQVLRMFNSGEYTIKQISDTTGVKLQKCHDIIDEKMKFNP